MEANKILTADILDIIFDGHNKAYGAYDLRKGYPERLRNAMVATGLTCFLLILAYLYGNSLQRANTQRLYVGGEVTIEPTPEKKKIEPILLPKIKPPIMATIQFVTPKIVKSEEVKKTEMPEDQKLADVKISTSTEAGLIDDETTSPPTIDEKGVVATVNMDVDNTIFRKVEIESSYPGGMSAWTRFLGQNLQYPSEASEIGVQGKVVIMFIVDQEGNTSNVEAIQGPEKLRAEAIRVIKKSGKWIPAIQNGRKVKSYKQQLIIFKLDE
jgi:periplasmic protein TonB